MSVCVAICACVRLNMCVCVLQCGRPTNRNSFETKKTDKKQHTNHFHSAQMYLFIRFYSIFRPGHRQAGSDRVTRDLISKRHEKKKTSRIYNEHCSSPSFSIPLSLYLKCARKRRWMSILIRHFRDEHFIFRWNFEKWINEFMDKEKKRPNSKNSPI